MSYAALLREIVENGDEGGSIVRDEFHDCALSTKDILKDPFANDATGFATGFATSRTTFNVGAECAAGTEAVAHWAWHVDGVDMRADTEGCGKYDGGRKEGLEELSHLIVVARTERPDQCRPACAATRSVPQ